MSVVWRELSRYPGYFASRCGRIKGPSGKILKPVATNVGYNRVHICISSLGIHRRVCVHRLVAEAYLPNPHNKPEVNHKNGIRTDNRAENLEWATPQENIDHSVRNGWHRRGEAVHTAKLTEAEVTEIRGLLLNGALQREIAAQFGVTRTTIGCIHRNKTWCHVKETRYD